MPSNPVLCHGESPVCTIYKHMLKTGFDADIKARSELRRAYIPAFRALLFCLNCKAS